MPKPWDDRPTYLPLREASIYRLEPVHLQAIQAAMQAQGTFASLRSLHRWVDTRSSCLPRLQAAMVFSKVLAEMLGLEQLDVLNKLASGKETKQ